VGYGKPPLHTRFKKGQSGNPRGRPRGAKNLSTLVSDALDQTVVVPGNESVTVAAVIETSHCVIHTWAHEVHDLTLYQFDLYSCAHFDPLVVCQILKKSPGFRDVRTDRTIGLEKM
jgi:S-adenosylmethionine/arginine decarboxylase-like enzyme